MGRAALIACCLLAGCHLASGLTDFRAEGEGGGGAGASGPSSSSSSSAGGLGGLGGQGGSGGGGEAGGPPTSYGDVVLADMPLAYWRFESTGSVLPDEVGSRDGAVINQVAVGEPGKVGSAFGFYTVGGRVQVPDDDVLDFDEMAAFTLEAWIYREAYQELTPILHKEGSNNNGWYLRAELDGRLRFTRKDPNGNHDLFTSDVIPLDQWVHVVAVYDGLEMRLYLDGELDGARNSNKTLNATTAPLRIGARGNGDQPFDGRIDEAALYDDALSEPRIAAHHAAGRARN